MPDFLLTLATIYFFSSIPLLVYAYTATGKEDFQWRMFFVTSSNRLIILSLLNLFAAFAVSIWPDSRTALSASLNIIGGLVGFVVPITAANDFLIGLLNGGFCVVALRGKG